MGELLQYLASNEVSFRRTINPDGYQANVAAWKRGLANGALAGHAESSAATPSLLLLETGPRLIQSLESKQFGRPLALGAVLRDAINDGTLMPLDQFTSRTESVYTKSSAPWSSVPESVIWWGLRQIGIGDPSTGEDKLPEGSFVIVPNLEAAAAAFESRVALTLPSASPFERTFSKAHFAKSFSDILPWCRLPEDDFHILCKYLSRDKGTILYDGHVVRIKPKASDLSKITQEDSAVASLRELIEDLRDQMTTLSSRVDELSARAREAIAKKNRIAALAALKSKKLTEMQLQTRHATLSQLEEVAQKLEQAVDQVQIVSVMKSSSDALRKLNAKTGGAEQVAEVLDGLREQMGEVDEVGDMISDVGALVDETKIDDEFEAMAKEEKARQEKKEGKAKEEESRAKAQELEENLLGAMPPSTEPSKSMEGEETYEAIEGLRRMSLVEKGDKEQPQHA
ncbi:hypothetical protein MKZ38_008694 [Zalerion maritima]|uniref:Uncharacterized protein n=1 Tax=Zalerion maritima TaxID=339359 RepID=A0AAD5WMD0_9PEZI|nr:hypothetical protein MKZ38_008694 [Zalerion maritima]